MSELVCIVCPQGCHLTVNQSDMTVSGNKCKRGQQFAVSELTMPMRTISSSVATTFASVPVLPVRVSAEIPKEKIMDVMQCINGVLLDHVVRRGESIISDVLGLGVDVIATSDLLYYHSKENQQ